MPKRKIIPVIMSGGSGSRLWPASRAAAPKQLLPLISEQTMIQETAERLRGSYEAFEFGDPVIICGAAHGDIIKQQMHDIGIANPHIIIEPIARNTAPCAAVAAMAVQSIDKDALMLLAPADHHISNAPAFMRAVSHAANTAMDNYIVTFGITTDAPNTGYGYIQKGENLGAHASRVAAFREKPNLETAKNYVSSGNYFWNAGIFLCQPSTLLSEMQAHCPEIKTASQTALSKASEANGIHCLDEAAFAGSPSDSIDYAVMEKTARAAVVEADIGWSDIGSWAALWNKNKDESSNALQGDALTIDTKNSLVHAGDMFVATIGVENLAIVVKDGALLVVQMDRVEDVKKIVDELKKRGDNKRL